MLQLRKDVLGFMVKPRLTIRRLLAYENIRNARTNQALLVATAINMMVVVLDTFFMTHERVLVHIGKLICTVVMTPVGVWVASRVMSRCMNMLGDNLAPHAKDDVYTTFAYIAVVYSIGNILATTLTRFGPTIGQAIGVLALVHVFFVSLSSLGEVFKAKDWRLDFSYINAFTAAIVLESVARYFVIQLFA